MCEGPGFSSVHSDNRFCMLKKFSDNRLLMKNRFLKADSSRPETCMLKKNKKFSDMRSLTTCLSLLDLLCALPACCLRMAPLLLLSPARRCLPSDPSLRKVCMLTDSPGPVMGGLLLPPGLLPGPTRYLHLLAAQDQPCCCCSSPVLLPQTIRMSCSGTAARSWW